MITIAPSTQEILKRHIITALETGELWETDDLHYPVENWIEICKSCGLQVDEDGFESNGWQWDWWQKFTDQKGSVWVLSGSGYYGGHSFGPEEE